MSGLPGVVVRCCQFGLQLDAREFSEFVRHGGDWRYGMIVARWVEKGAGHGGSRKSGQVEEVQLEKTSPNKFAKVAGVSNVTVTKYLNAWECAAENGYVPSASAINPGEEIGLNEGTHTQELWVECYRVGNKKKPETNNPDGSNGPPDVAEAKYRKVVARKIYAAPQLMELAPEDMARLPDGDEVRRIRALIDVMTAWVSRIEDMRGWRVTLAAGRSL